MEEISSEGNVYQTQGQSTDLHERLRWKCLDFGWIIFSWPGRFKAAEFLTTFLGFICVATVNSFNEESRYEFFVFVGIFSWIIVCLHMALGIPHLIEKLPSVITQPLVFLVCCCVAVLTWLIAASIVVAKDKNNTAIQAGAAFGYITMFLFLFEAVYYFILWRRARSTAHGDTGKEMNSPTEDNNYVSNDSGY